MSAVVWVHIDALSRDHPVFARAGEGARAVFVWDAADMARRGWTLKRCVFVMECVEDMGVEVIEGSYAEVLAGLGAGRILTADTPDPALRAAADAVAGLERVPGRPLTDIPATTDMGRFFRFWNKARRSVLTPTAELPPADPLPPVGRAR